MVRPLLLLPFLLPLNLLGCSEYDLSTPPNAAVAGDGVTGAIQGRICGPDGEHCVPGAVVSIDQPGVHVSTETDDDGWFLLEDVPVGEHTVRVSKGSFTTEFDVEVERDEVTELPEEECIEQGDLEIAVMEGTWDHIEDILDDLTIEYTFVSEFDIQSVLSDPNRLDDYDILFFNCHASAYDNITTSSQIADNLRDFVANGGSIYASDWAYWAVEATWPHMNSFQGNDAMVGSAQVGEPGDINAQVIDPVMAARLGSSTAMIHYDLPAWVAMEQNHVGEVLIQGSFQIFPLQTVHGPLAVRMDEGDGRVLYTTFHNKEQATFDMEVLLQEIILSL